MVEGIALRELLNDRIAVDAAPIGENADLKTHIGQPFKKIKDPRFQLRRPAPTQCLIKIEDEGSFALFVQTGKIDPEDRGNRFRGPKQLHPRLL